MGAEVFKTAIKDITATFERIRKEVEYLGSLEPRIRSADAELLALSVNKAELIALLADLQRQINEARASVEKAKEDAAVALASAQAEASRILGNAHHEAAAVRSAAKERVEAALGHLAL